MYQSATSSRGAAAGGRPAGGAVPRGRRAARGTGDVHDDARARARHASGRARQSVVTALRLMGVVSLVLTLTTETIPLVLGFHAADPGATAGLALLLLSQLGALAALLLPDHCRATPWVLLALLAGGIAVMTHHSAGYDVADQLLPGYWFFPLLAVSMRSRRRRDYVVFALVGLVVLVLLQDATVGTRTAEDVADQLWILQPVALALLFGDALIRLDDARTSALASRMHAQEALDAEQGAVQAQRAADRLVDEHLLPALGQVRGRTPRVRIVAACIDAWEVLDAAARQRRTIRLEEYLREDPAVVANEATVEGHTGPVPVAMAAAFAASVRAALSDAAGQPRRTRATITVEGLDDERRVRVSDPRPLARGREAQDRAVAAPLVAIGGQASSCHAQGAPGTVELRWPREEHGASRRALREEPDQLVRADLTRTAWPTLATTLLMTLLCADGVSRPALGTALGIVTVLLGVVAAAVASRRALPRAVVVLLLTAALAVWAVNLWLVPTSPAIDYPLWLAWGGSALVHLAVLSEPVATGAVLTGTWALAEVAGLVLHYGWAGAWAHSFLVVTGAGDVLITLLVLWVARGTAAQQAADADIAARLRAAVSRQQLVAAVQQYWGPAVTERALPLVRGIADGSLDPTEPQVQDAAAEAAVAVQRERTQV